MHPRRGRGARSQDLAEGEGGVERVLAGVGPDVEARGQGVRGVEDGPEDEGDEEGEDCGCGVEGRVEGADERGGPEADEGLAVVRVGECVGGGEEEVDCLAPVAENYCVNVSLCVILL